MLPPNMPLDSFKKSQHRRDTLTLLSVSLKALNKSLVLKVGPASLHLKVEGHPYYQR